MKKEEKNGWMEWKKIDGKRARMSERKIFSLFFYIYLFMVMINEKD